MTLLSELLRCPNCKSADVIRINDNDIVNHQCQKCNAAFTKPAIDPSAAAEQEAYERLLRDRGWNDNHERRVLWRAAWQASSRGSATHPYVPLLADCNKRIRELEQELKFTETKRQLALCSAQESKKLREAAEAKVSELEQEVVEVRQRGMDAVEKWSSRAKSAEGQLAALREALAWALGERDEFPERKPGEGAYWWRRELRRRALSASEPGLRLL